MIPPPEMYEVPVDGPDGRIAKLRRRLGVNLLYPTYREGLRALHEERRDEAP